MCFLYVYLCNVALHFWFDMFDVVIKFCVFGFVIWFGVLGFCDLVLYFGLIVAVLVNCDW